MFSFFFGSIFYLCSECVSILFWYASLHLFSVKDIYFVSFGLPVRNTNEWKFTRGVSASATTLEMKFDNSMVFAPSSKAHWKHGSQCMYVRVCSVAYAFLTMYDTLGHRQ